MLEPRADALNLGDVWSQKEFRWTIPLTNSSDSTVAIPGFRTSCSCTVIEPQSLSLGPHETADVNLLINLTVYAKGKALNPIEFEIQPRLAPPMRAAAWKVHGNVKQPFVVSSAAILFRGAKAIVKGAPPPVARLELRTLIPTDEIVYRTNQHFFDAQVSRDPKTGTRYTLQLTPLPALPLGEFDATVDVAARLTSGQLTPWQSIRVGGTGTSDVQVLPDRVDLGPVRIGTPVASTLVLRSTLARKFAINRVLCAVDIVARPPLPSDFRSQHRVAVSANVESEGEAAKSITFEVRYENGSTSSIGVLYTWYGLARAPGAL